MCPDELPSTVREPGRSAGYATQSYDAGLLAYFVHHRQSTRTRTDHQAATLPRDPLFNGERSVTKIIAESLGGLLFPFVNFSAVDDYVMVVCNAINSDGSEGKRFKAHMRLHLMQV